MGEQTSISFRFMALREEDFSDAGGRCMTSLGEADVHKDRIQTDLE